MRKALLGIVMVGLVANPLIVATAQAQRARQMTCLADCNYKLVDSRVVRSVVVSTESGQMAERGWKSSNATQRLLLLTLKVQRPSGTQFEIYSGELLLGFNSGGHDRATICHAMATRTERPDLDGMLIFAGPDETYHSFGLVWSKDKPDTFYLVVAMETYVGIDTAELSVAQPSGLVWRQETGISAPAGGSGATGRMSPPAREQPIRMWPV